MYLYWRAGWLKAPITRRMGRADMAGAILLISLDGENSFGDRRVAGSACVRDICVTDSQCHTNCGNFGRE